MYSSFAKNKKDTKQSEEKTCISGIAQPPGHKITMNFHTVTNITTVTNINFFQNARIVIYADAVKNINKTPSHKNRLSEAPGNSSLPQKHEPKAIDAAPPNAEAGYKQPTTYLTEACMQENTKQNQASSSRDH